MIVTLTLKADRQPITGELLGWRDLGGNAQVEMRGPDGGVATFAVIETSDAVERLWLGIPEEGLP